MAALNSILAYKMKDGLYKLPKSQKTFQRKELIKKLI